MNGDRLPPHDTDAEEAANGSLLIDGEAVYKIASLLSPQDFYSEPNQLVYGACLALHERNEAINQITVAQELDRKGKLETCGGVAYLSRLITIVPTSLDVEHYAQIVYRLSIMRQLISASKQIEAIGYASDPDVDASLNRAEDALFRLRHGQSGQDFVHIRQALDKYFETTPETGGIAGQSKPATRTLSGFTGLDEFLGGFQPSDLVVIAGRPSMGKTSFALSIAHSAAVKQQACVALFSLEMSCESLVLRFLADESAVNTRRVHLGLHLTEEEESRIMRATGVLSEAPIYIDDSPQLRIADMRSKARRLHFERGIDLIIVDYLQLLQADETRKENRVQEISYISRALKGLARELNVPVLAISQLSRAVEWRASHVPQLSDLRESGSIEQDADIVIFIYRDEVYFSREEWQSQNFDKEYPQGLADIIIAKHRNGPTGQVKLRFQQELARFENINNAEEMSLL